MSTSQPGKQPESQSSLPRQDKFTRFRTPPSQDFSYQPQVQHRLASLTYTTNIPYEQSIQPPVTQGPKFDNEAFELAFPQVEKFFQPTVVVEPEPVIDEEPKFSDEEEADRLTQTAGEPFDRSQHERYKNEKFRNSTFMALIKKLRDREVVVLGDEMVETALTLSKFESEEDVDHKEFGFQEFKG
jgi:hypothetical protein